MSESDKPWKKDVIESHYDYDYESDKPWEDDNVIPSHNLDEKNPIIQIRPGRPQILDLSHIIQFRPRPTLPPIRLPFITREQLEKRKKVLMEWTLTAQVKI